MISVSSWCETFTIALNLEEQSYTCLLASALFLTTSYGFVDNREAIIMESLPQPYTSSLNLFSKVLVHLMTFKLGRKGIPELGPSKHEYIFSCVNYLEIGYQMTGNIYDKGA